MFAAIDIGSNTVQMLTARAQGDNLCQRRNYLATTGLGAGNQGRLLSSAIAETAAIVGEYMDELAVLGVQQVRILATSAVRDALNSGELLAAIASAAPRAPRLEIINGEQEARLSYLGARVSLQVPAAWPVADVGGSSTELVYDLGDTVKAVSANVGALRAKVNGWSRAEIKRRLALSLQRLNDAATLVGVGGTITTAAGLQLGLRAYQREAIEGAVLAYGDLVKLRQELLPLSLPERCARSPLLHKRGHIMEQGLDIWLSLLEILDIQTVKVCGGGILDGAIAEMIGVKLCN